MVAKLGAAFGRGVCAHFGLSGKKVQSDIKVCTEADSILSVTLTIALTPEDLIGIGQHMATADAPKTLAPTMSATSVSINPGETLILRCERMLTNEQVDQVRANAEPYLPEGCKVLVLHGGISVDEALTGNALLSEVKVLRADLNRFLDGRKSLTVEVAA